jgi:hypothetical protein
MTCCISIFELVGSFAMCKSSVHLQHAAQLSELLGVLQAASQALPVNSQPGAAYSQFESTSDLTCFNCLFLVAALSYQRWS